MHSTAGLRDLMSNSEPHCHDLVVIITELKHCDMNGRLPPQNFFLQFQTRILFCHRSLVPGVSPGKTQNRCTGEKTTNKRCLSVYRSPISRKNPTLLSAASASKFRECYGEPHFRKWFVFQALRPSTFWIRPNWSFGQAIKSWEQLESLIAHFSPRKPRTLRELSRAPSTFF